MTVIDLTPLWPCFPCSDHEGLVFGLHPADRASQLVVVAQLCGAAAVVDDCDRGIAVGKCVDLSGRRLMVRSKMRLGMSVCARHVQAAEHSRRIGPAWAALETFRKVLHGGFFDTPSFYAFIEVPVKAHALSCRKPTP
jgi:hypothetical protein